MLLLGLAEMVESRDSNTGGHIKRTSAVVKIFASKLLQNPDRFCLTENLLERIVKTAPMHDLGKISIDDKVLRKPGKYTQEEYNEMKRHSAEGAKRIKKILEDIEDNDFVTVATNIAYYHHEKWDGTGYPQKLAGERIPLSGRIVAIADTYDALRSIRPYKLPFSHEETSNWIKNASGTDFDPDLVNVYKKVEHKLEEIFNSQYDPKLAEAILKRNIDNL
jgi:HD-GYP domain-containing protein (c-di-GMP phosphodiesterase class II)